jgi:hypothetical protein
MPEKLLTKYDYTCNCFTFILNTLYYSINNHVTLIKNSMEWIFYGAAKKQVKNTQFFKYSCVEVEHFVYL